MSKKILTIISLILMISLLFLGVFWLRNQKQEKKQDIPSGLTTKKTEVIEKEVESEPEVESSENEEAEQTTPATDSSQEYQILNNLEEINKQIQKLHDFNNGTEEYWNKVRQSLKDDYGIVVSDNTKGGFGLFDVSAGTQSNIITAIVISSEYEKQSDNQVKFRIVTRTGRAGVVDGDIDYTAKEVRKAIKRSGQDVTVDYQLNINADGKSGELIWLAGNWW